jgi:hypothetical protein
MDAGLFLDFDRKKEENRKTIQIRILVQDSRNFSPRLAMYSYGNVVWIVGRFFYQPFSGFFAYVRLCFIDCLLTTS